MNYLGDQVQSSSLKFSCGSSESTIILKRQFIALDPILLSIDSRSKIRGFFKTK